MRKKYVKNSKISVSKCTPGSAFHSGGTTGTSAPVTNPIAAIAMARGTGLAILGTTETIRGSAGATKKEGAIGPADTRRPLGTGRQRWPPIKLTQSENRVKKSFFVSKTHGEISGEKRCEKVSEKYKKRQNAIAFFKQLFH